ncbi:MULTISPECIES: tail assembly protein [Acinetobacter]|uniref:Tail assembly protein n=1 Tax=Acinetobacter piscicola TaxID=2006115 RepID=A0A7S7AHB5_9GAMM|nr:MULTISPECIES: tail assembly protein [Acinetobacter]MDM1760712.1 tail assembly protein [Acinetobacter sp. 251-1]QOW45799.1 tail assembly protein [Acinetobacter piscicola]
MLKTIKLYGILAKKFGKEFQLNVANTREAVRALSIQIPGFEKFMLHAHERGLEFAVFQDKQNISAKELDMNTTASVIKIVPRVIGAGGNNGVLQTILGAVMVVVGAVAMAYGQAWGANLVGAGIGMLIGGVAQMLMPKVDNTQDQNSDGNKANFGFGGAVTTVAQGNPVPVLRGRREIGGFIVSAGQYPEDLM